MNKTLKLFLMFILVLFFVLIFVNTNVYATEVLTLTQDDFTSAKNAPNEDTGKMKYVSNGSISYYVMTKSNYELGENINIGTATMIFNSDFAGEYVSLDLGNYTLQNATNDEYITANITENRVILFEDVNATITGTGIIKSNSEGSAVVVLETTNNGKTTKVSNIIIQGNMDISKTEAFINNVTLENGTLNGEKADITITGGNYNNSTGIGASANFSDCNVIINSGKFMAGIASAMYFIETGVNDFTLTINDGTFTSTEDNGIEIIGGTINIKNGTFTGAMSGITTSGYKSLKISGGTFKYLNTENGRGPIALYDVEIEDAIATIESGKVLSAGNFEKVEKEITSEYFDPYVETYIAINVQSVTIQSKDDNKEDTTVEISSNPSSDTNSVEANIKFTKPISKENKLEIKRKSDSEIEKELKAKEPNLKVIFDINIITDSGEIIKIENNEMTIKIKLDESLLGYDNYEIVYIKDGKIEERIATTVEDKYIVFKTSHLSEYGVIASNDDIKISEEELTTNPQTGDNIIMYSILSIVAIVGIISIMVIKKNK